MIEYIIICFLFLYFIYLHLKIRRLKKKINKKKACNDCCSCKNEDYYCDEEFYIPARPIKPDPINFSYNKVLITGVGEFKFKKPVDCVIDYNSGFEIMLDSYDYYDKFLHWNSDSYNLMPRDYKQDIILENDYEQCVLKGCFPTNVIMNNKNSKKMKVIFSFDALDKN